MRVNATTNQTIPVEPVFMQPFLPECLNGRLDNKFRQSDAVKFDPTSFSYYQSEVIPAAIAGITFSFLALILFIAFFVWVLYRYTKCCNVCLNKSWKLCCRCQRCRRPRKEEPIKKEKSESVYDAPPPPETMEKSPSATSVTKKKKKKRNWHLIILRIALILFGTATAGLCIAGIPVTLTETNDQISSFWNIVYSVHELQARMSRKFRELAFNLALVHVSVQQADLEADKLTPVLNNMGEAGQIVNQGLQHIVLTEPALETAQNAVAKAIQALDSYVGASITGMQNGIQPTTLSIERYWRVVIICVLLGLVLFCAVVLTLLLFDMRFPRISASFTLLMTFCLFLVLFIGAGLVRAVQSLADDACLYTETFVATVVVYRIDDPEKKEWVQEALNFYLDPIAPTSNTTNSAITDVTGVPIVPVLEAFQDPVVTNMLGVFNSTVASAVANKTVSVDTVRAINALASTLQPTVAMIQDIDYEMSRNQTHQFINDGKQLICCTTAHGIYAMFVMWAVIGAITFVFAILAIYRIISYDWEQQKRQLADSSSLIDEGDGNSNSAEEPQMPPI